MKPKNLLSNPAFIEKFWATGLLVNDCIEWQATRNEKGYGYIFAEGRKQVASRVSYQITRGPIPAGLQVCHTCDNPCCINPKHLFLGTCKQNMEDKVAKGRQSNQYKGKLQCQRGHAFPEYKRINSRGVGYCRKCKTEKEAYSRLLKKQSHEST